VAAKIITNQTIIGQQGVALVEKRVLDMGWLWNQTGVFDAGIDGYIELRDPITGAALNSIIQVQSRATQGKFTAETDTNFEYLCSEKDLAYWLAGNAPVILVCSRPATSEAYWVSIKDYFKQPERRQARRVEFAKGRDRFDLSTQDRLRQLAVPKDAGVYFTPVPRPEVLYSNLLPVTFPPQVFHGVTEAKRPIDVWKVLSGARLGARRSWVLEGRAMLSFENLLESPWDRLCERGTVDPCLSSEWGGSSDEPKRNLFVRLLNEALREWGEHLGLSQSGRRKDQTFLYFNPAPGTIVRNVSYRSLAVRTSRTVVSPVKNKTTGDVRYFRHNAFEWQFRRYRGEWFLEIVPTYHFTTDGFRPHPNYEPKLKGIKALERNPAVLGQLLMWAEILRTRNDELFPKPVSRHLGFGDFVTVNCPAGVLDEDWLPHEDTEGSEAAAGELPLFDT
jgi:uncharacterized protein DUF4365